MNKIVLFLLLVMGPLVAEPSKKTICLNMIVKDESSVIRRSLQSVKPLIDYWVIVDTGSTDGTQQIIRECMKDVPGELHEQPWIDFGTNRNEALKLAKGKGDYVLFIDADEELLGTFEKDFPDADCYLVTVRTSSDPLMTFKRGFMVNNQLDWQWTGVIHERLICSENGVEKGPQCGHFGHLVLSAEHRDGNRAKDPQKYLKDAQILEQALLNEPDRSDYAYYLAQSYHNANELGLALKAFKRRAKMEGQVEQTFWSLYSIGVLNEVLKMDNDQVIQSYLNAFYFRPTRAEPLLRLGQYFLSQNNIILAYLIAQQGVTIAEPNDIFYVEKWVYSYGMKALLGNCALQLGKFEEAQLAYEQIVKDEAVPQDIREKAQGSLELVEEISQGKASWK